MSGSESILIRPRRNVFEASIVAALAVVALVGGLRLAIDVVARAAYLQVDAMISRLGLAGFLVLFSFVIMSAVVWMFAGASTVQLHGSQLRLFKSIGPFRFEERILETAHVDDVFVDEVRTRGSVARFLALRYQGAKITVSGRVSLLEGTQWANRLIGLVETGRLNGTPSTNS